MFTKLSDWLDHRTGYRHLMQEVLLEQIPGGAKWQYVWGSTLSFTFMVQVITGFCLWMAYSPSATTAWESVFYIQHQMTFGWIVRGIHHFAAQAMMILLILHLMQVVIGGAYRAPREINFWLGLILAQIVMGLGLTGYLLPWDQKGYYATRVATEIMGSAPVVGPYVKTLVQGGAQYGHHTLTRFFALHAGVLPALLVAFLALHIYVFRRHGITTHVKKDDPDAKIGMFWPDQILMDAVACLAVLAAILVATFYWHGAELTAPANPAEPYSAARPEWYYLSLFKFLQFPLVSQAGEATHLGEAFGAIVIPGAVGLIFVLMPIIAYLRIGHGFNVAYMYVVLGIAGVLTGMAYYEDWYSTAKKGKDFRDAVAVAHRDGARAVELAKSPSGIPPEGAVTLLRNDPLSQGPRLFAKYCIDCHQPTARLAEFKRPPEAPELADPLVRDSVTFGSRAWIEAVLTDFSKHFAPLANVQGERSEAAQAILGGSMADWSSTNGPKLKEPANAEDFKALVEFLYAQSRRPDALSPDDPIVSKGQAIFSTGTLTNGAIDACIDCHSMHTLTVLGSGADRRLQLSEAALSTDLQPILTEYGGTAWIKAFINDPQAHYGDNNAMPAFADQLSPGDLDLIARWLSQDYFRAAPTASTSAGPTAPAH